MTVTGGDTDVSTFFMIRLAATGVAATGLTIANFSMQYTRTGAAPAAHAHPTALAAADTAHADNYAYECDATNSPGLYRFDWPDAAFAAGVRQVALYVTCATAFAEAQVVDIDPPMNVTKWAGTAPHARTIEGVPIVQQHTTGGGVDGPTTAYPANFEHLSISDTTGLVSLAADQAVNVTKISGDATAADTLELFAEALDQATGQLDTGSFATGTLATAPTNFEDLSITDTTGLVAVASIANDAITAASIAAGAIDNATFAADVGSTALATNMIAKAAEKAVGVAGASLTAITGVTLAATQTGVTIPTVTTLTNLPAITSNWLTATGIAADAITAAKLHADVTTELQAGLATAAQVAAIGSGSGAAMNFAPSSDNASTAIKTISKVGTQTGTFANCTADNGVYHVITNAADNLDWIYGYSVGAGGVGSQLTWVGYVSASALASAKSVTVSVYNFATPGWDTVRTIPGQAGTTDVTVDIPLLAAHTGTGAEAGVCYVRFSATAQAGIVLNTDMLLVQAQNLGQTVGYSQGSIWVKATGTAGTTPYVNGAADNPCPWSDALTLSTALGIRQFEIATGTTITLAADLKSASLSGHGWFLDTAGYDISYTRIEGCENMVGTALAADHEFFVYNSQISSSGVSWGEFDLHESHITGVITLNAEKPYLIEHCVGVPAGGVPTLAFGATADARAVVVAGFGGQLLVTGMRAGNVLILDGDCDLTIDNTNTGGTVYISGCIRLTYAGTGQTVYDTARWSEDQAVASVTGAVGSVAANGITATSIAADAINADSVKADAVTKIQTGLATATAVAEVHDFLDTEVAAILAAVDTEVADIKTQTDKLPQGIKKNTALAKFEFVMTDATTHAPKTGLTVAGARSIDGGAFAACTNTGAIAEVGNGIYVIDLAAADLNGTIITLRFSATGADDTLIHIKTDL